MVQPPGPTLTVPARRGAAVGAAAALAVLLAAVGAPARLGGAWSGSGRVLPLLALAWCAFGLGAWCLARSPRRAAVALILAGGLALPLVAAFAPPRSSDDLYRYLWDGRVQAAGVDPYRYPPAAAALAGLRDGELWPPDGAWCVPARPDPSPGPTSPGPTILAPGPAAPLVPGCTRINRPTVPTIYPPVAQLAFLALRAGAPPGAGYQAAQLLAIGLALATTLTLLVGLRAAGRDPRRAALWAWCPTVAVEAGSNAHIDVLAALLTAAALLTLARAGGRGRAAAGGALLGLAIATKLTPALALPAAVRRRPVAVLAAVAGAVGVVYAPHLLSVGPGVLGYGPGYLREEGFADGSRFALLTLVVPASWAPVLAVAILSVAALLVLGRGDPDRPWLGAAAMTGTALIVAAPTYPWYAMLLVVLVALGGRAIWLAVAAAGYVAQYPPVMSTGTAQRLGYGAATALILAVLLRPRWRGVLGRWRGPRAVPEVDPGEAAGGGRRPVAAAAQARRSRGLA